MFILKCKICGFEQVVKKRIDKETYEELINNEGLYCDRNCCEGKYLKAPKGYVKVHGVFGGWSIIRRPTLDEYRSIKRANEIRDAGLRQLEITKKE